MPILLKSKSIYFNDVNLLPAPGKVKSRKEVPNELHRIIVSPMLSVVGTRFINEASKLGLSVCTPRFLTMPCKINLSSTFNNFNNDKKNDKQICFLSIGLNETQEDLELLSHHTSHRDILFDIANGYVPHLEESVRRVYNEIGQFRNLMIGNIVTIDGLYKLMDLGKYCNNLFIRVGIGNGKPCSSSDVAAVNRGQLTELFELEDLKRSQNKLSSKRKLNLVSDGGISKSGFALKAFGAGADYVLMGSYFSKAEEAETHISGDGTYFGCASEKQNKLAGLTKHSEGKVININKEELKPLKYLVDELWGGISSGISYVGHKSVEEFIGNGVFEEKCNSLPPKGRV